MIGIVQELCKWTYWISLLKAAFFGIHTYFLWKFSTKFSHKTLKEPKTIHLISRGAKNHFDPIKKWTLVHSFCILRKILPCLIGTQFFWYWQASNKTVFCFALPPWTKPSLFWEHKWGTKRYPHKCGYLLVRLFLSLFVKTCLCL